ncbi:flagellar hook-basal body protein [Saccharibacillus kuerlensis]|uniref:Flagellar basal-body rod protein FlgG n=1 Tax=Saccharibacillus kuerlensis TaxID=459527 RepID=A0ABQ2KTY3_9BACL|nr:flagellar hook-basal body protein [Saccharibacillus kuerlensis]GGN93315.1 flagellar basal-body rod protein FlgG [Saccharibacillus kuerlensis]
MNNSMISAAVTMNGLQRKLEMISDNIANLDTVGYKAKQGNFQDVLTQVQKQGQHFQLDGRRTDAGYNLGFGARMGEVTVDLKQGALKETGSLSDIAIEGNALFEIQVNGGKGWTREGGFQLGAIAEDTQNVYLMTNQGHPVMGTNGQPIRIPADSKLQVDSDGTVRALNPDGGSTPAGQLSLARVNHSEGLVQTDGNVFVLGNGLNEADVLTNNDVTAQVRQGYVEQSNVDMTAQMTDLMQAQRAYQLAAKALTSSDTMATLANGIRQ